jgi:hypothetical protein
MLNEKQGFAARENECGTVVKSDAQTTYFSIDRVPKLENA